AVGNRRRNLQRIEFETAGHGHTPGIAAEFDETASGLLTLHAEPVDVRQHPAEEGANRAISRIRPRGDPTVDHDGLYPLLAANPQEVRPDLGLHHHEQARLDDVERASDDEREIEGEIEDAVDVLQISARHLLAGNRRGRYVEPKARVPCLQIA